MELLQQTGYLFKVMLNVILVLSLTAICCTGQRRWAGSYSRIHPTEDTVTWDDGNYPRLNVQTSTEESIRYRGKWPADNWKGQDKPDTRPTSTPRSPPTRRDQYDSRMDERPRSSVSQTEMFDIDGKRLHDHPLPEDLYQKGEIGRPDIVNERKYFPSDKGKEEDPMEDHNIPRTVDTGQRAGNNKGNMETPHGRLPQDRNQKRIPSVSTEAYDNRRRDELDYKGYEEPTAQRPKGERTHFPTQGYVRPRDQPKIVTQDDMEKASEELPQGRNQKRYRPITTEGYDDEHRDDVGYKGYEEIPATLRPKGSRPHLTAREYVRPRDQTDHINKGDRNIYKQSSRDKTDDRTVLVSKQDQDKQYTPTQSKGDTGYDPDWQREERLAAREYDKRREEELKQREYERRLEEEMRKKDEEKGDISVKGAGHSSEHEEVRERNHERRQGIASVSENDRRKGQEVKGTMNKGDDSMREIVPVRRQEEHSSREYVSRGIENSRREEAKGRNFGVNSEESPKENDDASRSGVNTQERRRQKGEGQTTYDLRLEDEYRTMKGDESIRRPDRKTNQREIVHNTRQQSKAQNSEERHGSRIESPKSSVRAKGEVYDRGLDYNPRPPVSRDYKDVIQRTTSISVDDDDLRLVETTVKRYHSRQDYNRNRRTERPLVQGVTDSSLRPTINSQRKEGSPRNREIVQPDTSLSQRRNTNNHHRNSEESIGSIVTSSYGDVNDRHERRTDTRREESVERFESKGRNLPIEGTVQRAGDFINPVYSDSGIRQNSPDDQVRDIAKYPSVVNSRNNARQPTKASNSWKQSSSNNWKPSPRPLDVSGYHPNVSYDTIVFLDDESDEEGDVWNLSDRKASEPSHSSNEGQENYKRDYISSARESQGKATQRRRNEANITLISGVHLTKPRNRRASEEYRVQETRFRSDLTQIGESADIHPDVEFLPGYGITRQSGKRNYNDDVIDDEVELFSEKEIKVDSKDYKTSGIIAAVRSQPSNSRTSMRGRDHEELQEKFVVNKDTQFNAFNVKDTSQDGTVRHSQIDPVDSDTKIIDSIQENSTSSYSTKTNSSQRIYNKSLGFN